jgi:HAD domain in Swiss Army Knife RNA repair proteins
VERKRPHSETKSLHMRPKPLLLLDVDGVLSLFGFPSDRRPNGTWLNVEGIPHLLSANAPEHLQALAERFELVWCTGWEERANEHLLAPLALPGPLPCVSFDAVAAEARVATAHWKLDAVIAHVGERPLAWIDDAFNDACHEWARDRTVPTLLVTTLPQVGLTGKEVGVLSDWARRIAG